MDIKGEYWIEDGYVQFADGDIGDRNHEGYAIDAIFGQYGDAVADLAEKLGIEHEINTNYYDGPDTETISETLTRIYENLTERKRPMSGPQANAYIMRGIHCNQDALQILTGGNGGKRICNGICGLDCSQRQ